jgi:hypothetical protein
LPHPSGVLNDYDDDDDDDYVYLNLLITKLLIIIRDLRIVGQKKKIMRKGLANYKIVLADYTANFCKRGNKMSCGF